jgi:hypothetical protein
MTFDEAVETLRTHCERLFPKACSCGRRFDSLSHYIRETTPVGPTISYDATVGDWRPAQPLGSFALANCRCGNTLALSTDGMPLSTRHALLAFIKGETERMGSRPHEVTDDLRAEVRRRVLADKDVPNRQ